MQGNGYLILKKIVRNSEVGSLICDQVFFLYLRLLISTRALPSRYTTGYLQRCLQWVDYRDVYSLSHFTTYPLSTGQYLVGTLGYFRNVNEFNFLGHLLEVLGRYV